MGLHQRLSAFECLHAARACREFAYLQLPLVKIFMIFWICAVCDMQFTLQQFLHCSTPVVQSYRTVRALLNSSSKDIAGGLGQQKFGVQSCMSLGLSIK